ncbi:MAG: phosphoribosyltransferase family protein [Bacilli bacterium]|nr:phosphoribosyltransferase family protein [Bacilli bacterium]
MQELILSNRQIEDICKKIAKEIDLTIQDEKKTPVVIGVLKGGVNYMLDLIKYIESPILTDYIQISSWEGMQSTGIIHLKKDLTLDIEDRTIILVDDVIDSGYSYQYLKSFISQKYKPKNIYVTCLIDKQAERKIEVKIDFPGYILKEPKFLMGYGLDYKEYGRNIGYVYVPDKEEIDGYDDIIANGK